MVVATNGKENDLTELFNGTAGIFADTTEEKGGSVKYFRPHDLLEAASASCLNMTTRMALDAMKLPCDNVTVRVGLDRSDEAKTVFGTHKNRWNSSERSGRTERMIDPSRHGFSVSRGRTDIVASPERRISRFATRLHRKGFADVRRSG